MKVISRMRTPMAGRTCLFLFLCLLSGCWDSHPKQVASDQPAGQVGGATASSDQPSGKAEESSSTKKSVATSLDDEFGFKRTWKPGATPPAKSSTATSRNPASGDPILPKHAQSAETSATAGSNPALGNVILPGSKPLVKSSAAAPDVVAHGATEDDRYAELAPAPAVGSPVEAAQTPAYHSTGDTPPAGNPLRDPGAAAATGRPEAPPQPAMAPEPVNSPPENLPTAAHSPRPMEKAESVIEIKPEGTAVSQAPVTAPLPATPVAPVIEKKPEPKEHNSASAKPGPRTNKNSGVPFDPIAENHKFFEGWPKPKLALVITGNLDGYLEPCGCAGLDRMNGGLSRRFSLFRQLRQDKEFGWPVVGLDVGGIAKGFGKQAELKFQIAVNAMSEMHYSAVTLGLSDLHLPTAEVMALTMPADAKTKTMFVCGNVGLFAFDESLLPRTKLIVTGYKTIGVTAVLGKTYMQQLAGNTDLTTSSSENLLNAALPLLKARANFLVLLAHTTKKEAIELANKYPDLNLVICSDGGAEPPKDAEEIRKGGTKLIEVGEKGMYAVVLGMFDDPQQPLRYQRVVLDSRYPASPEMLALMGAYQGQLKDLGLSGLGIRPLPHPLKPVNGDFVGTDACKNCHEESYRVWKKTPHSRGFATLQNVAPPRNYDPECISCHTVGWNPAKFFPYQSGYLSEKETPKLINVGCENCHGPGQLHVRAENHGTAAEQVVERKAVRITKEEMADPNSRKQNCWMCHDLDNSPEFKFDLYWPYVKHYEHE